MNTPTLESIFAGIPEDWKNLLVRELKQELTTALIALNKVKDINTLRPSPADIFNFARKTPFDNIKIVLLGQDPYPSAEANGLSFSCNKKIQPSLSVIFNNLMLMKLIGAKPVHGNLDSWASQGILLLNASLTTMHGVSNAHKSIWVPYTDAIIRKISQHHRPIFILLGNDAIAKTSMIDPNCKILTWGHPSPLNRVNQRDCPANFKYCTVFKAAHEELLSRGITINWDNTTVDIDRGTTDNTIDNTIINNNNDNNSAQIIARTPNQSDILPPDDSIYIFTDGGCTANGKSNARSSYAFYIITTRHVWELSGIVPEVEIAGEEFKTSNNRGELLAISSALKFICDYIKSVDAPSALSAQRSKYTINIITDSKYAIGCYTVWGTNWKNNPEKQVDKKNLDIIMPIIDLIEESSVVADFKFIHIRSHKKRPVGKELFYWNGNDIVDKMCQRVLSQ